MEHGQRRLEFQTWGIAGGYIQSRFCVVRDKRDFTVQSLIYLFKRLESLRGYLTMQIPAKHHGSGTNDERAL
jgi:hypothetical protein